MAVAEVKSKAILKKRNLGDRRRTCLYSPDQIDTFLRAFEPHLILGSADRSSELSGWLNGSYTTSITAAIRGMQWGWSAPSASLAQQHQCPEYSLHVSFAVKTSPRTTHAVQCTRQELFLAAQSKKVSLSSSFPITHPLPSTVLPRIHFSLYHSFLFALAAAYIPHFAHNKNSATLKINRLYTHKQDKLYVIITMVAVKATSWRPVRTAITPQEIWIPLGYTALLPFDKRKMLHASPYVRY